MTALALRERYVDALITRLAAWPLDVNATPICERIERNIAQLGSDPLELRTGSLADLTHIVSSDSGTELAPREFGPEHTYWTPKPASLSDSQPIGRSLDSTPESSAHLEPICGRPYLDRTIELGDGTAEAVMGTCWLAPEHDGPCGDPRGDPHAVYLESPDEHAEHADSIAADPEPDPAGLITLSDPVVVAPEPEPAQPLLAQMSEAEKARGRQQLAAELAAERADTAEREPRVERVTASPAARPTVPIKPLRTLQEICEPGCGGEFNKGIGFATHRRACREYAKFRAEHMTTIPATFETHPPAETPDPLEARNAFEATRRANAGAAAERTRQALRGEDPPGVAQVATGGTQATEDGPKALTARQAEYVVAIRASKGNIAAAARAMQLADQDVRATLAYLRKTKRMPADVEELVAAHKAALPGARA